MRPGEPPPLGRKPSSVTLPKSPFVRSFGSQVVHSAAQKFKKGIKTPDSIKSTKKSFISQLTTLVIGSDEELKMINVLLLAIVLSGWAVYFSTPAINFLLGFLALIPLAALLGELTEDLAVSLGDTWGALINVTFGNATEVIICMVAIQHQMFDIIKASMLGSILGNMLLVLGTAFMAAGYKGAFTFNKTGVAIYSGLLLLSCFALIIPTALSHLPKIGQVAFYETSKGEYTILLVSRCISVLMVSIYCIFVYYQSANKHHFEDCLEEGEGIRLVTSYDEDDEDCEEPQFDVNFSVTMLAITTIIISIESEIVVQALEPTAQESGISKAFIAVVLLPIVGNVCEHASAITMAVRGKMDVAIGVAVGSSIQIVTFVIPLLVLISWAWNGENPAPRAGGKPGALDLNFHPFCTVLMLVSVLVVNAAVNTEGTWITGLFLLSTYTVCVYYDPAMEQIINNNDNNTKQMIAISYWFVPSDLEII